MGNSPYDLELFNTVDLKEPKGWAIIPLYDTRKSGQEKSADTHPVTQNPLYAMHIGIYINSNHQNGKDARIRQIKLFAKKDCDQTPIKDLICENEFCNIDFFASSRNI